MKSKQILELRSQANESRRQARVLESEAELCVNNGEALLASRKTAMAKAHTIEATKADDAADMLAKTAVA